VTSSRGGASGPDETFDADRLALVRAEIRFEIDLLHQRVNALIAAEAFLTIAYTAAMSNGATWAYLSPRSLLRCYRSWVCCSPCSCYQV